MSEEMLPTGEFKGSHTDPPIHRSGPGSPLIPNAKCLVPRSCPVSPKTRWEGREHKSELAFFDR